MVSDVFETMEHRNIHTMTVNCASISLAPLASIVYFFAGIASVPFGFCVPISVVPVGV